MSESRTKSKKHKSTLKEPAQVLEQVLMNNKSPLSDQFLRWKLWRKWDSVVGPTIAAQSMPVGFVNGVLYVWVKNAVWMQEMLFLAGPVKEKVNTFAGKNWIKSVRFTLNQHEVPQVENAPQELKDL
jgi:predicted nucleic acid-binding Zn ribbon protein